MGPELSADGLVEDTVTGAPPIDQVQGEVISAKWHNETIEIINCRLEAAARREFPCHQPELCGES
jgi:hypothetical protein